MDYKNMKKIYTDIDMIENYLNNNTNGANLFEVGDVLLEVAPARCAGAAAVDAQHGIA